jgi:hypothetical protein
MRIGVRQIWHSIINKKNSLLFSEQYIIAKNYDPNC